MFCNAENTENDKKGGRVSDEFSLEYGVWNVTNAQMRG
jgi:hypothetical protein